LITKGSKCGAFIVMRERVVKNAAPVFNKNWLFALTMP